MSFPIRRGLVPLSISFLLLVFAASACSNSSPEDGGGECTPGLVNDCPPAPEAGGGSHAEFCAIGGEFGGVCTNVCAFAINQLGSGNEGDFCVNDDDCDSGLTCDNDTVGAEMPCHCIVDEGGTGGMGGNGGTDCVDVTPGDGLFGSPCRNDGDCLDGLPCCTSIEVSEACGVEVGLCECI